LNFQRRSYASAFRPRRLTCTPEQELRKNYRVENSHQECGGESAKCSGSDRADPQRLPAANLWKMHRRRGQTMVFWRLRDFWTAEIKLETRLRVGD
jgi:hypothetical protein